VKIPNSWLIILLVSNSLLLTVPSPLTGEG
jgi:hypothetical protein